MLPVVIDVMDSTTKNLKAFVGSLFNTKTTKQVNRKGMKRTTSSLLRAHSRGSFDRFV